VTVTGSQERMAVVVAAWVVALAAVDMTEALPAASIAWTVYEYVVDAVRPVFW